MINIKTSLGAIFCFVLQLNLFALNNNSSDKILPQKNSEGKLFYFGNALKNNGIIINTTLAYNTETGYGFDMNSASNATINSNTFSAG